MRTDVKIGIAVGLLLAIVVIIYFAVTGFESDTDPQKADATAPKTGPQIAIKDRSEVTGTPEPADTTPPRPDPSLEIDLGIEIPPVADRPTDDSTDPRRPPYETAGTEKTDTVGPGTEATTDIKIDEVTDVVIPRLGTGTTDTLPPALLPDPLGPGRTTPVAGVQNYYTRSTRIYTVRDGDNGFWSVSKYMYGDGKYMDVIAGANPDADPESLRAGQKLTVPPLPEKYLPKAKLPARTPDLALGERIYVVKKGDAGFWGVSVSVYGHGKHWKTIAKANPGVDSDSLRPGQKLVIPPKPTSAKTEAVTTAKSTLPAGWRTYVVVSGDAGFWDVAVKMYGNGRLHPAIARVNPGVQSRKMQVGQRLRIPPLAEARRLAGIRSEPIEEPAPLRVPRSPDSSVPPVGTEPRPDLGG